MLRVDALNLEALAIPQHYVLTICRRLACLVLLSCITLAHANVPVFSVAGPLEEAAIGSSMRYWVDDTHKHTIADVTALPDSAWTASTIEVPSLGFVLKPTWFNGQIRNDSGQPQSFLLELGYTTLDDVQIYLLRGGAVAKSYHTGDLQAFNQRPVYNRN